MTLRIFTPKKPLVTSCEYKVYDGKWEYDRKEEDFYDNNKQIQEREDPALSSRHHI